MRTLKDLIDVYDPSGYIMSDKGNGAGFSSGGQYIAGSVPEELLGTLMQPESGVSDDGVEYNYASSWIRTDEQDTGSNPHMIRVFI